MTKKRAFFPLFMTIFNDALNYGIVLVIFAPMLIGENFIFLPQVSESGRTIILGLLFAVAPLGQLISSPFFGAMSDAMGRKKVLLVTLWGTFLFTVISAIAIHENTLALLFLGRFLSGCMSGNATLAQAAVADLSSQASKTKNLSIVGIAGGLAWIIGAPLGGILADSTLVSWFHFATPIWFLALSFLVNALATHLLLAETYKQKHSEFTSFRDEIKNITKMFHNKSLRAPLTYLLLFYLGWFMFLSFFPTLLVMKFHFTQIGIGFLSGWSSVAFMAGSFFMAKRLSHRYSPKQLLFWPTMISLTAVFITAIVPDYRYLILTFAVADFYGAIIWIAALALISNLAGEKNQGKVFGVQQALLSFGTLIAPIVSGFVAIIYAGLPLMVGACLLLLANLIYYFLYLQKKEA